MRFRVCAVVPTYDNPMTVADVVERVGHHVDEIIVVDDGSHAEGRAACEALGRRDGVEVLHADRNRGKGAAVRLGFERAHARGFTHAFQVDADGQHDLDRMPAFLAAAEANPQAAIVGYPEYDESLPTLRSRARRITTFWVDLELGEKGRVADAMIGFRIYPIAATLAADPRCNRMAFDVEVIVKLVRSGVEVVNLPVGVRYLDPEEGGRSHFQPVRDNVRMFWLHSRLCAAGATRWCIERITRPFRGRPA